MHTSPSSARYHASASRGTKGCVSARALIPSPVRCDRICIKTGKSKHYGFIEFVSAPVAQIVAETMDNYLLMSHILTCKVIPKDEVHPELWVGANRKWRVIPTYRLAQAQHNKVCSSVSRLNSDSLMWLLQPRNEKQQRAAEKRLMNRQESRKRKLAEAGIVYNFEKVGYVSTISLY